MSMVQIHSMGGAKMDYSGMSMKERMAHVRACKKMAGGIVVGGKKHKKGGLLSMKNTPFGGKKKGGLFFQERPMGGEAMPREEFLQQEPWGARIGGIGVGGRKNKKMGGMPVGGMVDDEFVIDGGMSVGGRKMSSKAKSTKSRMSKAKLGGRKKLPVSLASSTTTPTKMLQVIKKVLFPTKANREKYGSINWKDKDFKPILMNIIQVLMSAEVEHEALMGKGRKMKGGFGWSDVWDGVKSVAPLLPLLL